MGKKGTRYAPEFRRQMVELVRAGRVPAGFTRGMTNKKHAHLTGASAVTAQRDVADLLSKGNLLLRGAGRSARYELAEAGAAT